MITQLVSSGTSKQLHVDGHPFLIRGLELQNSSFSSPKYMAPLWERLKAMNINTVLGSVSWELIEPKEGHFDFEDVDRLILDARKHGLKLILLWFGTWKNGFSNYVPAWVKLDPKRFTRVVVQSPRGKLKPLEILSPLCKSTLDADTKAFVALMAHVRDIDSEHSTVIMVQPENEIGVLGDSRDRSVIADEAFKQAVPSEIMDFLESNWDHLHPTLKQRLVKHREAGLFRQKSQSWIASFGDVPLADELFMAYHYALFLDSIASAGKAVRPLPMFCNFWLNFGDEPGIMDKYPVLAGGGNQPGDYPSGGALSHTMDIWMRFAPNIDMLCPDTYLNDYRLVCATYRHRNQPLFIPEQRRDEMGARRMWHAIGCHQAIGCSPFGVDSLTTTCAYTHHFDLLRSVSGIILNAQRTPENITGFFFDELEVGGVDPTPGRSVEMAGLELRIDRAFVCGHPGPGFGLVICLGDGAEPLTTRFLLVGEGFQVTFKSSDPGAYYTGILKYEEKEVDLVDGGLHTLRRLNGDETRSGSIAIMPNSNPDYGGFPISITIPAVTRIAECTVYVLS